MKEWSAKVGHSIKGFFVMIWSFIMSFKKTRLVTKIIARDVTKFVACLIMAAGVFVVSAFAGNGLGFFWGLGVFLVMGGYAGFLFWRYLYTAKTVPSIIDGTLAVALLFVVVLAVAMVSLFLIVKMSQLFNGGIGTLTFLFCGLVVALFMYRFATISEEVDGEI